MARLVGSKGRSDTFKIFYNYLTYFMVKSVASCRCERRKLRSTQEKFNGLYFYLLNRNLYEILMFN